MKIKYILSNAILLIYFTACGSSGGSIEELSDSYLHDIPENRSNDIVSLDKGLEKINDYRESSSLKKLSLNEQLNNLASSHASYLIENNLYTHDEDGKSPTQRAKESPYPHTDIAEDIYAGDVTESRSVEILFSNIYHRLSFLDFGFDEIGLGYGESEDYRYSKVYTYELGRKNSRDLNSKNNPKIILFPYKDQADVMPVFYEEEPDPLPECSVSGYPISVQFNPLKNGQITLREFELYENGKLIDSKILPHDGLLSIKEFVLMPLTRLKFDTTYHVKFSYFEDDNKKSIEWDFTTKKAPYEVVEITKNGAKKSIKSGKTYYIYLPPKDCNDKFSSYTYTPSKGLKIDERMIDNNTIKIKAIGNGKVTIYLDNGREFTVYFK